MSYYPVVRPICTVIDELRSLLKYNNHVASHSTIMSLIEEMQTMANRMEACLEYKRDIFSLHDERKKLIAQNKKLKSKKSKKSIKK